MAAFLSSLLAGSALLSVVNAQNFGGNGRDEDAFSYMVRSSLYSLFAMLQSPYLRDAPCGAF
jgi:hypothetical protein